ncbi:hypothetical protein AU210_015595 [Fusarium oxysporum f. sp. radicis-cucumerinum]|uniref:HNH nuclease domain-containing protein n=1 Tax=Fusarium oxysporum f. sp. radicis-cucumerinum TaxID=327505 RepID=A0A2H3GBT8_FUSOX|nr:hypothetical protein AU210_015595 [Fusarium oxysporum f. sp. radicis-cucumerinum]
MSTASITPVRRALGWNLVFLAGSQAEKFAGVFSPPGSDTLTYRHIIDEFRLCFDMATVSRTPDVWHDIAFFQAGIQGGLRRPVPNNATGQIISGSNLDTPVETLPFTDVSEMMSTPSVTRMHVVRHHDCNLNVSEPLETHIREGCAQHIPIPTRRREPRYLPPNKSSKDPKFTQLPYRKTIRAKSQSPGKSPKRSASGLVSPTKNILEDSDVTELITPPVLEMDIENAKQQISSFRSSCLSSSRACAVTGKGRSWFGDSTVGPTVQACHIVPQQQYHTYPTPQDPDMENPYSSERLCQAWQLTWSVKNGILLLSHLHELFDARLFSIHPETFKIRVFVPYDVILEYHGREAIINWEMDTRALRHHYDMCCIENMTAQMPPWSEDVVISQPQTPSVNSGAMSPFEAGPHVPRIAHDQGREGKIPDESGDPTKKPRRDEPKETDEKSVQYVSSTTDDLLGISRCDSTVALPDSVSGKNLKRTLEEQGEVDTKRQRVLLDDEYTDYGSDAKLQTRLGYWPGRITPDNSQEFLSDVNYSLQRLIQ